MSIFEVLAYVAPVGLSLLAQVAKGKVLALHGRALLLTVMVGGAALAGVFSYLGDKQGLEQTLQIIAGALLPLGTWAALFSKDSLTPPVGNALNKLGGGTGEG